MSQSFKHPRIEGVLAGPQRLDPGRASGDLIGRPAVGLRLRQRKFEILDRPLHIARQRPRQAAAVADIAIIRCQLDPRLVTLVIGSLY